MQPILSNSTADEPQALGDAAQCIRQVRATLWDLINGIPDFTFRRPNDLSNELGLDPKLAWTLGRCVEAADPFVAAQFIPGPTGMRKFLQLATRRRVDERLISAADRAFRAFERVVRSHAGTRKEFNTLATGVSTTVRQSSEIDHRRRAFEGSRYIWGVQARTIFRTNVVAPSLNPERWDLVTLRGIVDFQRLRPNVAWRISRPVSVDKQRTFHHEVLREPLDRNIAIDDPGLPLVLDACSQPIPKFRAVRGADGGEEFEFVSSSVGRHSQITCVTGELLREVEPRYGDDVYDDMCFSFPVRTPDGTLVFDILIHRSLFPGDEPVKSELFSDLFGGGPGFYYEESDRLPLHEAIEQFEQGDAIATPDIPGYGNMLKLAIDRSGCNADEFDVFRLRMEFPPLSTTLMIRRTLPRRLS